MVTMEEYSYDMETENNAEQAEQLLQTLFPDLAIIRDLMLTHRLDHTDIIEFFTNVALVQRRGYGTVQMVIADGKIQKHEATIPTLKMTESQQTVKP